MYTQVYMVVFLMMIHLIAIFTFNVFWGIPLTLMVWACSEDLGLLPCSVLLPLTALGQILAVVRGAQLEPFIVWSHNV